MTTQPPIEFLTCKDLRGPARDDHIAHSVDSYEREEWYEFAKKFLCYSQCFCCGTPSNLYDPVKTCLRGVVLCLRCESKMKRKTASRAAKKFVKPKKKKIF